MASMQDAGLPMEALVTVLPVTTEHFYSGAYPPNGDGLNDTWEILLPETVTNRKPTVRLFNRVARWFTRIRASE
ncbi:MAG: hypothetical protein H6569_07285 [Lewinellaceae bacterium]|nr:hypothetical protein [Lewinellaceae bacterium]